MNVALVSPTGGTRRVASLYRNRLAVDTFACALLDLAQPVLTFRVQFVEPLALPAANGEPIQALADCLFASPPSSNLMQVSGSNRRGFRQRTR